MLRTTSPGTVVQVCPRCQASIARITVSRPDADCVLQVQVLEPFWVVPSSLGSGLRALSRKMTAKILKLSKTLSSKVNLHHVIRSYVVQIWSRNTLLSRGDATRVQGYLADKKTPSLLGPPYDPRHGPTVEPYGLAFSCQ